jgi:hypothetical protein
MLITPQTFQTERLTQLEIKDGNPLKISRKAERAEISGFSAFISYWEDQQAI